MTREERNEKARVRMAAYRKTDEYKVWLNSSRELRRSLKEKYRRESGAIPRDELTKRAADRASAIDRRRIEKADFMADFVGPPVPGKNSMSESEYYRWRICNDPEFYAKELDRAQRYKVRMRSGYKGSIIGWAEMPSEVKQVKHLQFLIKRQIKRTVQNENHQ